jgi:hypothetical protein
LDRLVGVVDLFEAEDGGGGGGNIVEELERLVLIDEESD